MAKAIFLVLALSFVLGACAFPNCNGGSYLACFDKKKSTQ